VAYKNSGGKQNKWYLYALTAAAAVGTAVAIYQLEKKRAAKKRADYDRLCEIRRLRRAQQSMKEPPPEETSVPPEDYVIPEESVHAENSNESPPVETKLSLVEPGVPESIEPAGENGPQEEDTDSWLEEELSKRAAEVKDLNDPDTGDVPRFRIEIPPEKKEEKEEKRPQPVRQEIPELKDTRSGTEILMERVSKTKAWLVEKDDDGIERKHSVSIVLTNMPEDVENDDMYDEEEFVSEEDDVFASPNGSEEDEGSLIGELEAVLFAMGEPLGTARLADAIQKSKEETEKLLRKLKDSYNDPESGIRLMDLEGSWQLCTKEQYFEKLKEFGSEGEKPQLTDVVMETLSIIACKQPVTRSQIEKIRGVSCEHAVSKLLDYELIEEKGRLEIPGKPIILGTTDKFLRYFGMESISELPVLDPVQIEDFKMEAEAEVRKADNVADV